MVEQFAPHALRRTQTRARGRSIDVAIEDGSGLAALFGTLFAPDAKALDQRLDALASTVCPADPRTRDQRRADAMGTLAHRAMRLACLCDTDDCPAADSPPSSGVVIHVVAHQDTIAGPMPDGPPADSPLRPRDSVDPDTVAQRTTDECTTLDGVPPPMFTTHLRELPLAEAMARRGPEQRSTIAPAVMIGGGILPGPVARRAAHRARIHTIVHPGQAPPERRYRPSKRLADFVRCRDLTCRFPGWREPATNCDLEHTIPWPDGPTCASNITCLCRRHHLLKTFWGGHAGWRNWQLPDGNVIWTAPDGQTHTTTPGSRLLFPTLCDPTAPFVATGTPFAHTAGLTMPRRRNTRAEDRARRIDHERELNRTAIERAVSGTAILTVRR